MGTPSGSQASLRVVLDTNVLVSALLFRYGVLGTLRDSWQRAEFVSLAGRETLDELVRVLGYPKFKLTKDEIAEVLATFLPYAEIVTDQARQNTRGLPRCRDAADQKFLVLAAAGRADVLVSGDAALLDLSPQVEFSIERPADFLKRLGRATGGTRA